MNFGETAAKQIIYSLKETENGIPITVHMPYFPNDRGCLEGCTKLSGASEKIKKHEFLKLGIAAFLVSRGKGSYFRFSAVQNY